MFELSFTARNVLIGASLLGATSGLVGCFALLRRQSLLGDALAHTALPGVCIAFLLTQTKASLPLLLGAAVAGVLGAIIISSLSRLERVTEDSAIGIILSVFFGFGIVLLTIIQRLPSGNQSGLDKYLFGQAATLVPKDLVILAGVSLTVLALTVIFFKELKMLAFDRDFGESLGFRMRGLELLQIVMLVLVVVVGLQMVGVVLIVAALITPAAAARQWTDRLAVMLLIAAGIGAISGSIGAMVSAQVSKVPTGPVIVLVASAFLIVSLLLAPRRGLVWAWLRQRRVSRRIQRENLLKDLWLWCERANADTDARVPWSYLRGGRGQTGRRIDRIARGLARDDHVETDARSVWLTASGAEHAQQLVRKHRLWELYLTRRLELASDHVHRDADAMEHTLTDEAVARIEELLDYPTHDPHGQIIPQADKKSALEQTA